MIVSHVSLPVCMFFQLTVNLALVLLHDYFFGKGIQCGGPMKYCIFRHKEGLNASFNSLEYKNSKKSGAVTVFVANRSYHPGSHNNFYIVLTLSEHVRGLQ